MNAVDTSVKGRDGGSRRARPEARRGKPGGDEDGRIVVVSNRVGPASSLKSTPGGLAIAMRAALGDRPAMWFGWSGSVSDDPARSPQISADGNITRALIDLPRADFERYYAGFANRALWPLFHYRMGIVDYSPEDYAGYKRINEEFARHMMPLLRPDDVIWVHDYQLIPLGAALRAAGARQRIGFFLHTPFPGPDVLSMLPVHDEVIRYLADYDLVGFQTATDATAFADYIVRVAHGKVGSDGRAQAFGRRFLIGHFPIGIDVETTATRARSALSSARGRRLRDSLAGRKMVIGVDRLDYTKGLIQRFKAIEILLEEHPEHRRGAVVLQIATPTRGEVPEYKRVRAELNELIGHINGRYADPDILPIRYLNKQFGQYILFGFFRISAVGLITPLRDGMNLVAKEYVASQSPDDPGVLVLSCFAGAAQQMDAAVIVNPFDPPGIAAALHRALTMPIEERRERHGTLLQVLRDSDLTVWRDSFLHALVSTKPVRRPSPIAIVTERPKPGEPPAPAEERTKTDPETKAD